MSPFFKLLFCFETITIKKLVGWYIYILNLITIYFFSIERRNFTVKTHTNRRKSVQFKTYLYSDVFIQYFDILNLFAEYCTTVTRHPVYQDNILTPCSKYQCLINNLTYLKYKHQRTCSHLLGIFYHPKCGIEMQLDWMPLDIQYEHPMRIVI